MTAPKVPGLPNDSVTAYALRMRILGRFLQIVGLAVLPLAIVLQLAGLGLGDMLVMMVAGASSFYLGRIVEAYG